MRRGWRLVAWLGAEVWWWLSGLGRLCWRHPVTVTVFAALLAVSWWRDAWQPAVVLLGPVVGMALWCRLHPVSYSCWVSQPLWRYRMRRQLRRGWPLLMESVELLGRYSKMVLPPGLTAHPRAGRSPTTPGRIHGVRKRLGSDVIQQLVQDYEAGESTVALMESYGLGKGTVLRILEEQGVEMRGQGLPADKLPEAADLYQVGWSLKRLGTHYGCSADTIRIALNQADVPLRAPWERMPPS